jgi:hypothetical protein
MPIAAEVDGDLEEPGREAPLLIKPVGRADDAQPGLLVQILDIAPAGPPVQKARQRPFVPAQQLAQRGLAAFGLPRHGRFVGLHPLRICLARPGFMRA